MQIFIPHVLVIALLIIGLTGFFVYRTHSITIKIFKLIIYEQQLAIKDLRDIYTFIMEEMTKYRNMNVTTKKSKKNKKRNNQQQIKIRSSGFSRRGGNN